jgi:2,3-diaminopropionate biosynthesis protein SbnA
VVLSDLTQLINGAIFLRLDNVVPDLPVFLKLEGYSATGSIKIKPAVFMLASLEESGRLRPGGRLVESSSGNLGLALSMACAARGYSFTCVSDPNLSPQTAHLIRAYGAALHIVQERDANGGYLGKRLELIESMLSRDPELIWLNQYGSLHNIAAHRCSTGAEILAQFPRPDYVFVGAGTTGTLGGISQHLREHSPRTRIVAVDTVGSVTFGQAPGPRRIPGLGTSQPPPIREHARYDELHMVPEAQAIAMCREMARRGVLVGGSTGTVLCAVRSMAGRLAGTRPLVVAVSPDMGDRYADTIYNPEWVDRHFSPAARDAA